MSLQYAELQPLQAPQHDMRGGAPTDAITVQKMGAPLGVATLDDTAKIPVEQMRMALETRAEFDALEQSLPGDPGDLTLIFNNQLI